VNAESLWFESVDTPLCESAEAFATALLIPAMLRGEDLELDFPVDETWLSRLPALFSLLDNWWGLPEIRVVTRGTTTLAPVAPPVTAQCFSGGADSFYELVSTKSPPDVLVFARGFDIDVDDGNRFDAFLPALREIAGEYGAEVATIRTNYRKHSVVHNPDWMKMHGGLLAAFGHLMSQQISRFVIPSSYPYYDDHPWGSHWDLDPLWSSGGLAVVHADATLRRRQKLDFLGTHELAMRHLRVCWDRRTSTGNCSQCEKCIRTMIILENSGTLSICRTFDLSVSLTSRLDNLRSLPMHLVPIYQELYNDSSNRQTRTAITRLIWRSRWKQVRRKLRQTVNSFLGRKR
jgi:hypothetical protein